MTRKQNKNSRGARRSASSRGNSITKVAFHHVTSAALVAGGAQIRVRPSATALGAVTSMYDAFDLYKCVKLRFRLLPNTSMASAQTASYYPESQVTAPTIAQNTDCIDNTYINNDMTIPSRWVSVPRTRLQGQLEWYKSIPDAGELGFEDQGIIDISGTTTESYYIEVEGTMLFKNPNNPAVVMDRIRKQVRDEFQQSLGLQKFLPTFPSSNKPTPSPPVN
jgi:hypothetical protein